MTNNIAVVIADDEPLGRRGVRQLLARHPEFVVVRECTNGADACTAVAELKPEVVFADIEMPGLNGLQVLRLARTGKLPAVVLFTAHAEFALEAFELHAVDYLMKPLNRDRFNITIGRLREYVEQHRSTRAGNAFVVNTGETDVVLRRDRITWAQARDYYSCVFCDTTRYLIRESLVSLHGRLGQEEFVRVHRGALVSLAQVVKLHAAAEGSYTAVLRDGTLVPVSRRRYPAVRSLLRRFHQHR